MEGRGRFRRGAIATRVAWQARLKLRLSYEMHSSSFSPGSSTSSGSTRIARGGWAGERGRGSRRVASRTLGCDARPPVARSRRRPETFSPWNKRASRDRPDGTRVSRAESALPALFPQAPSLSTVIPSRASARAPSAPPPRAVPRCRAPSPRARRLPPRAPARRLGARPCPRPRRADPARAFPRPVAAAVVPPAPPSARTPRRAPGRARWTTTTTARPRPRDRRASPRPRPPRPRRRPCSCS